MAGFPFMRQAEAFRSSLPFILLLAVFMLGAPLAQAAGPREQKTGGQLSESEMDTLLRGALTSYKEDGDVQPEE